tara:strand:- start:520 stop:864 length:345 start_codon:yes stop_codon:yes gene_type:complete
MFNKKGQGLSLNVIIVAALALIVLVVLVMVFTGRIAIFDKGLGDESKSELIKMKIQYGGCQPTASAESGFTSAYDQAESLDDKDAAKDDFLNEIDDCKRNNEESSCEGAGCRWS